jgi:acetylornithine/N-succinyldiaminopimelate aminotransferase
MDTKQLDNKYVANTYARYDLTLEKGKGSVMYSEDGGEYIDLGSGISVNVFGVGDQPWITAVTEQLSKLQHSSNHYYTNPQARLAQLLCEKTGMSKVFFGNSGAEANECAIKCARKYSQDKYGKGRHTIITLTNSFHGRTIGTLSATGQDSMHISFDPFLPGFVHVPPDDMDALMDALDETVCAVFIEIIQGEGGVYVLDTEYISKLYQLCQERDILLLIDEVQTGMGRTGSLFAFMQFGIMPDIVTTAKSLGGGLPIGACLLGEKVKDTLSTGSHGSTFGGNPVCAAGAVSIVERLDDKFLLNVIEKGNYIRNRLQGAPGVISVSGLGMMIGIKTKKDARAITEECISRGVIVLTAKDKVRLLPPLNIPQYDLERAIDTLLEVIAS